MKSITKIVLTGGPCSGKSTFIDMATDIFSKKGYRVFVDHESATDLITGGISPATMGMYNFQKYCIELQKKKEELFCMAADEINAEKVLIFYDRGILDDKGYLTPEEFTEILQSLDIVNLMRQVRYGAAFDDNGYEQHTVLYLCKQCRQI